MGCLYVCVGGQERDPGGEIWRGRKRVFSLLLLILILIPACIQLATTVTTATTTTATPATHPPPYTPPTPPRTNPAETAAHHQLPPLLTSTSIPTHPYRLISRDILSRPTHRCKVNSSVYSRILPLPGDQMRACFRAVPLGSDAESSGYADEVMCWRDMDVGTSQGGG
jgi:hypothetical protein